MNKFINQLLQLHELELTLKENQVLHKSKGMHSAKSELEENIRELKSSLPFEIISVYDRISKRYPLPISPMVNGACTGCFIKLPVGIANRVMSDNEIISCPTCQRFLYFDDSHFEGPQTELHYKGIARFSSPELMFPRIKVTSKDAAIKHIAMATAEKGFVYDGKLFTQMLLQREALASTTMEDGLVFPHARDIKACGLTLSVATASEGIKSDKKDGAPLRLFFVSAVPRQTSMFYLELVSKLAQYFCKSENLEKFLACEKSEQMWKLFVQIGK